MRSILIFLLLGALFIGLPAPGGAQTGDGTAETPALMLERWETESSTIERRLAEDRPQAAEIDEMRGLLDAQRNAVPGLIAAAEADLKPIRQQLEALGELPEDPAAETPEIAAERKRLTDLIAAGEARLKLASQAGARATALHSKLTTLRRSLFSEELLNRGPSLLDPEMPGKAWSVSLNGLAAARPVGV